MGLMSPFSWLRVFLIVASLNVPLINTQNLSSGHQPGHIGDYGSGPTRLNEDITISQMIPRRNPPRGLNAADLAAAATRLKKPKVVPKKKTESELLQERLKKMRRRMSDSS